MLKSILFLLVLISFITTPTRAYEAYSISSLNLTEEQEAAEAVVDARAFRNDGTDFGRHRMAVQHQTEAELVNRARNQLL